MGISFIIPLLGLIGGIAQIIITGSPIGETLCLWLLPTTIGFSGLWAFTGHIFKSDMVAKYIGWKPKSGFQWEVGWADLSYGVLGVLCIWWHDNFWLAAIIANSIFLFGCVIGHIKDYKENNNRAPGNIGIPLYVGIIFPLVTIACFVLYKLGI